MKLTYRNVSLEVTQTLQLEREAKFSADGTTYLHTHWRIRVLAYLNPAALAFVKPTTPATLPPVATPGTMPALTDAALRHYMMQPHGTLKLQDESGNVILQSPAEGYTVDANNGPVPQSWHCKMIAGIKSWHCEFAIETWVNENATTPVLLGHRWRIIHEVDQDFISTVTHEGEAVFNVGQLAILGKFPDQYRVNLFPAVPNYFQRTGVQVVPSEDGAKITYRVTDREMPLNLGAGASSFATRYEAFQSCGWEREAVNGWAAAGSAFYGAAPHALQQAGLGVAGGKIPGAIMDLGRGALSFGERYLRAMTPKFYNAVTCRAWGNRSHKRLPMLATCLRICLNRIMGAAPSVSYLLAGLSIRATMDLMGKFCEVTVTKQSGPEQLAIANMGSQLGTDWLKNLIFWSQGNAPPPADPQTPWAFLFATMSPNEEIVAPDDNTISLVTASNVPNPAPPNSNRSRGQWVGQLFANALSAMDASKPPAPDDGTALNGTTTDVIL